MGGEAGGYRVLVVFDDGQETSEGGEDADERDELEPLVREKTVHGDGTGWLDD